MFGKKEGVGAPGRIDSLIGAGTRVDGNICFSGGVRVDGEIKGNVQAADSTLPSILVLSEQGTIEGAVCVNQLVMNGRITGEVVVTGMLEMQAKARIAGDVEYVSIEMHQGAVIEGRLLHRANSREPIPDTVN